MKESEVTQLAMLMHNKHIEISKKIGWRRQTVCLIDFKKLPPENLKAIKGVARAVLKEIRRQERTRAIQIINRHQQSCFHDKTSGMHQWANSIAEIMKQDIMEDEL